MAWVVVIIIIVVFVAAISKPTKKPPEKYIRHPDSITKSDNDKKVRIANGEHDEMYYAWKDHHKWKSLEQIEQYIKEKREESWRYWEYNRLEYKVLMELYRELEAIKNLEIKNLIESEQVYQLDYSKLLEYFRIITYNPHIYKGFKINMLTEALDKASYNRFYSELIQKAPSAALRWINARENEGEYIADKLKYIAEEIQKKESPEESYKRQRKNIQSNISKAKKDEDWLKIEELKQKLSNLNDQKK